MKSLTAMVLMSLAPLFGSALLSLAAPAHQDITGQQIVEQAIDALAVSPEARSFKSFALTGTMVTPDSPEGRTVKIVSKGQLDLRLEVAYGDGTSHVLITRSDGNKYLRDRNGRTGRGRRNARAGTEVPLLPLPALVSDLLSSAREHSYVGLDSVNGHPAYHITLSRQFPSGFDADDRMTKLSTIHLFVDTETHMLMKLTHAAADLSGRYSSSRTVMFDDYREVNGTKVPFSLVEIVDGQKTFTLTVESIDINPHLSEAEFAK
jgi:hypothetical protein